MPVLYIVISNTKFYVARKYCKNLKRVTIIKSFLGHVSFVSLKYSFFQIFGIYKKMQQKLHTFNITIISQNCHEKMHISNKKVIYIIL